MAERRMFALTITDSDAFLDMSLSAQALYFHLCMRADDDGFLTTQENPEVAPMVDFRNFKRFLISFPSGGGYQHLCTHRKDRTRRLSTPRKRAG